MQGSKIRKYVLIYTWIYIVYVVKYFFNFWIANRLKFSVIWTVIQEKCKNVVFRSFCDSKFIDPKRLLCERINFRRWSPMCMAKKRWNAMKLSFSTAIASEYLQKGGKLAQNSFAIVTTPSEYLNIVQMTTRFLLLSF